MSNCPNCGGVLNKESHCDYCGTNVIPYLNIFNAFGNPTIELNVSITNPRGEKFTIPLIGKIGTLEMSLNSFEENDVEFTFEGRIRD